MPRSSSAENQDDCIRTIDKLEARIKRLRYLKQDLAERLEVRLCNKTQGY